MSEASAQPISARDEGCPLLCAAVAALHSLQLSLQSVWGQCCLLLKKELFKMPSVWPGLKRHLLFSLEHQSCHIWSRKWQWNAAQPRAPFCAALAVFSLCLSLSEPLASPGCCCCCCRYGWAGSAIKEPPASNAGPGPRPLFEHILSPRYCIKHPF